jgi:hypothetical protein
MKPTTELLTAIAREHLFFETLETRNSDSLDFKDVCVGAVKDALEAAYEAGARSRRDNRASECLATHEAIEALQRAEFLMRRVYEGDHHALQNLPSAVKQARTALGRAKNARRV